MKKKSISLFKIFICLFLLDSTVCLFGQDIVVDELSHKNDIKSEYIKSSQSKELSESSKENESKESADLEKQNVSFNDWLIASTEVLASNLTLFSFNHFILRAEYAKVDGDTIYSNLSNQLVWDQDTLVVNQLGHPYQGSFYFCAGRANGLSFAESLACNVLGSVSWEYFCENERQSLNDLICTTFGGAALGEVFHRLYLEAYNVKSPLAFLISPMDALNGLITGKNKQKSIDDGITSFFNYLATGPIYEKEVTGIKNLGDSKWIIGNICGGFSLVYGNPFICEKNIPFSSFIFDFIVGGTKGYYNVSIMIDSLLNRFGTKYSDYSKFMFGTSMLFDVTWSNLIGFSANGIGFSFCSLSEYNNGFTISLNGNLSWVLFGGSDYYNLYRGNIQLPNDDIERRLYDYGTGFYTKYNFCVNQIKFGCLSLEIKFAGIFNFETAVPEYGSDGFSIICNSSISYDHIIKKSYSLGISSNVYFKYGYYYGNEDIIQNIYSISLYGKRKLK